VPIAHCIYLPNISIPTAVMKNNFFIILSFTAKVQSVAKVLIDEKIFFFYILLR